MVVLQHLVAPDGVAAGRGYSQVVTGRGRLVVISGQVAQNERGELVGPGDPAAQARQVFENLRRCLAQAGAGFGDVVKLTFFVLDVADLPAVRAARDAVIDTARPPASTAVQVAALFAPGYLIEVEAWALVGELAQPELILTAARWHRTRASAAGIRQFRRGPGGLASPLATGPHPGAAGQRHQARHQERPDDDRVQHDPDGHDDRHLPELLKRYHCEQPEAGR
jgi:enamine deaminase RidA (YjgF/YER057c/UK114 family)